MQQIVDQLLIKMQFQVNSHSQRNSCGFTFPEGFSARNVNNKGFPVQGGKVASPKQEDIAHKIQDIQYKHELNDSPTLRKATSNPDSPFLSGKTGPSATNKARFKPYFPPKVKGQGEEKSGDEFLRGSCSNLLRKFDSEANLTTSLRNTTKFNVSSKFTTPSNELKKSSEEESKFGLSSTIKHCKSTTAFLPKNVKQQDKIKPDAPSRTPPKFIMEKQMDASMKLGSKTPVKYKNVFENSNKNSGISKVSTQTEQKKVFKSLNEIVQSKAKEKMILQNSQSSQKRSRMINGFEIGAVLGKGKFGQVFLARQQQVGFVTAIKKVVKSKVLQYKMLDQFCGQIRLHLCLQHPNIVRLYGFFQDKEDIYLAMQYMNGGTLFDYLNQVNYLSLRETVEYLRDIIQALTYMHQKSIAHRDIKPENIVISSQGVAKLCDFGWSAIVQTSRKTYCGTFDYAPPEILQRKNYDASVDIWCIGILTYELLTGRVPFEGERRDVVRQKIVNVDKMKIDYSVNIAPEAKQFIEALIQKDPNLRPKSQDLLKFKLFSLFPSKMKSSGCSKKGQ